MRATSVAIRNSVELTSLREKKGDRYFVHVSVCLCVCVQEKESAPPFRGCWLSRPRPEIVKSRQIKKISLCS